MTTRRPSRQAYQPELPLQKRRRTEDESPELYPHRSEWRLDEHTRLTGLLGIANARAQLGRPGASGHSSDARACRNTGRAA
ncbi:MAG: hypothetical protein ACYCV7_17740 [Acidimicrobiales bacterium]